MKYIFIIMTLISSACIAESNNKSPEWMKDQLKEYHRKAAVWINERDAVKDCNDIQRLSAFLNNTKNTGSSAETSEAYSEFIENLIFENTTCLLDAVNLMNKKDMSHFIYYYLSAPLYNSVKDVEERIFTYKEQYIELFKIYDEAKYR